MNKIKTILYFLAAIAIVGCNGLGKMAKNFSQVKHEVTPNPLELRGDSVGISVKGTFPPKYFARKVDITSIPFMKTSSGEHEFKSVSVVGDKSTEQVPKSITKPAEVLPIPIKSGTRLI